MRDQIRRHPVRLLMLFCLIVLAAAQAQLEAPRLTDEELAALPLVGVHVTAVGHDSPGEVTILLPRPIGTDSDDHLALLSDDCLVPVASAEVGADEPLGLQVRLQGTDRCATRAVVVFDTADGPALAAAAVVVSRTQAPPLPVGLVSASLGVDRIDLPPDPQGAHLFAPASLLRLKLTNLGAQPLSITKLFDEQALTELAGALFTPAAGSFDGTWGSLQTGTAGFAPTELAPGAEIEYFLALGSNRLLATGSWAVTIRPAFEVDVAGTRYSLILDQVSIVATPPISP